MCVCSRELTCVFVRCVCVCVCILTVLSRIRPSPRISACCCTGCLKFWSKCACVCVCLFFVSLICWFYFASAKCITVQHRSSLLKRRGKVFCKRLIRCTVIMAVPKAAGNGASLLRSCHMLLARAEGHRGGGALLNSLARNQSWRKVSVFLECLLHSVS